MKNYIRIYVLFAFLVLSVNVFGDKNVSIVFIGNSITYGAGLSNPNKEAAPVNAVDYLRNQKGIGKVEYLNEGVSGCTTVDFLPSKNILFWKMIDRVNILSRDSDETIVFSIMLGTNDSAIKGPNGSPVSPNQYYDNMREIIDKLLELYPDCKIVLHRPIWYSPNTYNGGMYLKEGLLRLQSYYPEIRKLVDFYTLSCKENVYLGDVEGFDYFKENYDKFQHEDGNAGVFFLHPTKEGAVDLGNFWGKAIYNAVFHYK